MLAAKVEYRCINASRHWSEYRGAFDDWLAAGRPDPRSAPEKVVHADDFHDPFYAWLGWRGNKAAYRVSGPNELPSPGWKVERELGYRDWLGRRSSIYVHRRVDRPVSSNGSVDDCMP